MLTIPPQTQRQRPLAGIQSVQSASSILADDRKGRTTKKGRLTTGCLGPGPVVPSARALPAGREEDERSSLVNVVPVEVPDTMHRMGGDDRRAVPPPAPQGARPTQRRESRTLCSSALWPGAAARRRKPLGSSCMRQ